MSKGRNTSLDIISNLDEEIIARNSERRYKLLSKPHRKPILKCAMIVAAAVLLLALVGGVIIASFGGKLFGDQDPYLTSDGRMVPIYQGMTVSKQAPNASATIDMKGVQTLDLGDEPAVDAPSEEESDVDQGNPFDKEEGEDTIEDAIGAVVEVVGPAEKIYYAKKSEDLYVTIHVNNPDSVEILSFTLNGVKYSSYMFEKGSDMENLVLKCNAGEVSGLVEYTIDAIKYIDGTDIKDVRMEGDQTVTVGVYTENQPYAKLSDEIVGHSHISFSAIVSDPHPLITSEEDDVFAVLYDGEHIVAQTAIEIGKEQHVIFEDLDPDKVYQYAVVAVYDALDGQGRALYILDERAVETDTVVTFENFAVSNRDFSFDLRWSDFFEDKTLKSISLWQDGSKVRDIEVGENTIGDLLSDTEYTVIIEYDYLGKTETIEQTFVTEKNEVPSAFLLIGETDKHTVSIRITETDPSEVGEVRRLEIIDKDGNIAATISPDQRVFEGLLANNAYKVVMTYVYDLNDGNGEQTFVREITANTEKYTKPSIIIRTTKKDYTWMTFTVSTVDVDEIAEILKVEFLDGDTWKDVGIEDTYLVEDLVPGNEYSIKVTYQYDMKDGAGAIKDEKIYDTSTKAYKTPSINITKLEADPFSVDFEFDVSDIDDVGYLSKIELIREDGLVIKATNLAQRSFEGIDPLYDYILKISYEYDLLDNQGKRTLEVTKEFMTQSQGLLISNGVVKGIGSCTDTTLYINMSVGDRAFAENKKITTLYIGSNATEVGAYAFYNMQNLAKVVIYDGVATIGASAFQNCDKLSSIVLPDSLEKLGMTAFHSLDSLESIHLPNKLETIPEDAFSGCGSLKSVTGGEGVKYIKNAAFNACKNLANFEFSSSLITISDMAFAWCGFEELDIPQSVRLVGNSAFEGNYNLKYAIVPDGITNMGEMVFANCDRVILLCKASSTPDSWSAKWNYCFDNYTLDVYWSFDRFMQSDGVKYAVMKDGKMLALSYDETVADVVLQNGTVALSPNIFRDNKNIESIVIPEGVTHISDWAFQNCESLMSVKLPSTLKSIGMGAFMHSGIEEIILPDGLTEIGNEAFAECRYLEKVILPDGIKTLNEYVFRSCEALRSIIIPEGVTHIDNGAFAYCYKLEEVVLPSTLKVIDYEAFGCCHALEKITLPNKLETIGASAFNYIGFKGYFVIPQSVTKIGENAFENMADSVILCVFHTDKPAGWNKRWNGYENPTEILWNFKEIYEQGGVTYLALNDGTVVAIKCSAEVSEVVIPEGVSEISDYCFQNCVALKSVKLPSTLKKIGKYAFYNSGISSIEIPDSVIEIGEEAFGYCSSLVSAKLPARMDTIPKKLFCNCGELLSIVIPEGVVEIGSDAFRSCNKLKTVVLPSTLKIIGDAAFGWCYGLETIVLPEGLEKIGKEAFCNDYNITGYLVIPPNVVEIGENAFGNMSSNLILCMSHASKPAGWHSASNGNNNPSKIIWNFKEIYEQGGVTYLALNDGTVVAIKCSAEVSEVVIPEGVNEIADNCFAGCSALEIVKLPSTLKKIGDGAFIDCKALESIVIPEGVSEIADNCFAGCTALESVNLPSTLKKIGIRAFADCRLFESIVIPEGVEEIGTDAFRECNKLKTVVLPSTLKTIGDAAFGWCYALESIVLPEGLEKIGKEAFFNDNNITGHFVIPTSITEIGENAFNYMSGNPILCVSHASRPAGWHSAWNGYEEPTEILWNFKEIYEQGGVTYLKLNDGTVTAIKCSSEVSEVVIPEGVSEIADNCFAGCTALEIVKLPSTLKKIGDNAFIDCMGLLSIVIPEGVTEIGDHAFRSCEKLASVILPKSLKVIGDGAFWHSYKLEFPELPEGLESIGAEAFWNTGNDLGRHQNIIIPLSVTEIGKAAFWYSYNITIYARAASMPSGWSKDMLGDTGTSVIWNFDRFMTDAQGVNYAIYAGGDMVVMSYSGSAKNIVLPSGVVYIERNAFENNDIIESIIIPEGALEIGDYAFANCMNLTDVSLPSTLEKIGHFAFSHCRILSNIELPAALVEIGERAFENCKLLTEIELPTGITYVSNGLFAGSGLVSIVIPEGVTEIGDEAFAYCYSLSSLKLPTTLKRINNNAFVDCDSLSELDLPDGLGHIGEWAFSNCDGLRVVVIPESVISIDAYAFEYNYNIVAILTERDSRAADWDIMWNGFDRVCEVWWGFKEFKTVDGVRYAVFKDGSQKTI